MKVEEALEGVIVVIAITPQYLSPSLCSSQPLLYPHQAQPPASVCRPAAGIFIYHSLCLLCKPSGAAFIQTPRSLDKALSPLGKQKKHNHVCNGFQTACKCLPCVCYCVADAARSAGCSVLKRSRAAVCDKRILILQEGRKNHFCLVQLCLDIVLLKQVNTRDIPLVLMYSSVVIWGLLFLKERTPWWRYKPLPVLQSSMSGFGSDGISICCNL